MAIEEATGITYFVLPTLCTASVITYHPSFITVTATVTLRISASEHDSSRASADRMLTRGHKSHVSNLCAEEMLPWLKNKYVDKKVPFACSVQKKEGWR